MKKETGYRLFYKKPAPAYDDFARALTPKRSWERFSLPVGNGFLGACTFGRLETERIQITENSMFNPYKFPIGKRVMMCAGGLNNFAEIFIDFNHSMATEYERSLELDTAESRVSYVYDGVQYRRTVFASYPDRVLVVRVECDREGALDAVVRAEVPFVGDFNEEEGDGLGKSGSVTDNGKDTIILGGRMEYYGILFEGQLRAFCEGGKMTCEFGRIYVEGANSMTLIFACGTNYKLESRVFTEPDHAKKLDGYPHPHEYVSGLIEAASALDYETLYLRHVKDYQSLYKRFDISLKADTEDRLIPTDELLKLYKEGRESRYLEALICQYGRYLLISSSRKGGLPANLQGIWNCYASSPWSSGYWHNINVQMNYWPSCISGLAETFIPYIDYARAYMKKAENFADDYVAKTAPENLGAPGENGWIIGTGAWPYDISGSSGHSGPGTGAFTSLLFWDYYEYTGDTEFLRDFGYPALAGMSRFFTKTLCEYDGKYLVKNSASPEQRHNGEHYQTVGCAFDQQMVYENYKRTLEAAEILGIEEPLLDTIRTQIDKLDPVLVGESGQVKEYREERFYSDIGDPHHRHVSHLVGLYPATVITEKTPEWLDAARVTLTKRGDKSTGWAAAHRLCLWTRAKCPDKSIALIRSMINNNFAENLWDLHPPFQIDGNFGYTAGVCEMLLQSQGGYLDPLPSLPKEWKSGKVCGICARGGHRVDLSWEMGSLKEMRVYSGKDGTLRIKVPENVQNITLNGKTLENAKTDDRIIGINTSAGDVIILSGDKSVIIY